MAAETENLNIAEVLFKHILNGDALELFPVVPEIPLPFGLTVHCFMLILSAVVILAFYIPAFRRPTLRPGGLTCMLESVVLFVRDDIVYPIMGEHTGSKWLPFFTTLFLFIVTVNFLGLIPAFKTATGNINVTTALALIILALMFIMGFAKLGFIGCFKNMYPSGGPVPIGIFILFLETIGIFIKSMVLSLRIFANMFAGHLAILSFLVLIFVLSKWSATIAVPFAIFTYLLEILVALIQAFVFTLLSCIFINMSSSSH
jgi:F-type H+-transporting ATPase subunit a